MEEYILKTIKAYEDTKTYEDATRLSMPKTQLDEFLSYLAPGSVILDAGCAYGRDTEYMKLKGFQLEAIDLSPAFIARAKELQPNLDFAVKDVRDTGFTKDQFDGVWCNATLLHLQDKDMFKALQEFQRILKPGGLLAVSLKKGEGTSEFVESFSSKSARFFNFKTHETFLQLLTDVGFKEIAWHYVNVQERNLDWLYSFSRSK